MGLESVNQEPDVPNKSETVDDIEMAHEMANKGDYFRSQAALLRKQAEGILEPKDIDDEIRRNRVIDVHDSSSNGLTVSETLNAVAGNFREEAEEKDQLAEKVEQRVTKEE